MGVQLQIKIQNIQAIQDGLKKMPAKVIYESGIAVEKSIMLVEREAKREAPVNKESGGGNLRQSISSKMTSRASGEVNVNAKYASAVHEGTRPHTIRTVSKRVLANKRNGKVFGKVVRHPGTKANPFLQRAVDKSKDKIEVFFETAIRNIMKI